MTPHEWVGTCWTDALHLLDWSSPNSFWSTDQSKAISSNTVPASQQLFSQGNTFPPNPRPAENFRWAHVCVLLDRGWAYSLTESKSASSLAFSGYFRQSSGTCRISCFFAPLVFPCFCSICVCPGQCVCRFFLSFLNSVIEFFLTPRQWRGSGNGMKSFAS